MKIMKSRARCVPLQYLSSATRGVKQALNFNQKPSNQNLFVVSTLLQEKNSEKNSIPLKAQQFSEEVSSAESKMYYELGNKRRMECELYQDCSWFQQDTMKGNINSKLSLAEVSEPIFDPDEFDLAMQIANANNVSWEDEYLEVFDHDILQEPEKFGEKMKNSGSNFKVAEDNACDTYNVNFSLRKTDSFDSMKNISYTNPAEIIPISYKEKLNNSNYGSGILENTKNSIKEEVDLNSPESNSYMIDSDDNDLNIGREEIVEEINSGNYAYETTKRDKVSPDFDSADIPLSAVLPIITPIESEKKIQEKYSFKPQKTIESAKKMPIKVENNTNVKQENEKLALNIDLAKVNIEQSINVNTPDLYFMDLVEYINEEMNSDEIKQSPLESQNVNSSDSVKFQSAENQTNATTTQNNSQPQNESNSLNNNSESSINTSSDNTTVDLNQLSDAGVSIAERIKTSAKRRTPRKYSVIKDIQTSEDEEDSFEEDDDDEDEDYDFTEDAIPRKSVSLRKRLKSSASESSSSGKKFKEDSGYVDSYRERRDKNNEASRRSRQNRKDRERLMYKTLEEEERRNVKLKAESDVLEKQVTSLRQLLLQVVLKKGSVT